MENERILHTTVLDEAETLSVGITVETVAIPIQDRFFVATRWVGTLNLLMDNLRGVSDLQYLMGTIEGFRQEIKLEFDEDHVEHAALLYHNVMVNHYRRLLPAIKVKFWNDVRGSL